MLKKLAQLEHLIGNTPLVQVRHDEINLYAKLEYQNMMGSIKVRPAYYILKKAIEQNILTPNTTVIESSSGNFAIALAAMCRTIGLKFIPVIDANTNQTYERLLEATASEVIKVTERDETGGFQISRVNKVKELCEEIENAYWPNQYGNPDNYWGQYYGLGEEIGKELEHLDYVFIGVSSGGTVTGLSKRLKERYPNVRVIAVDSEGSVIFGSEAKKRFIPGIGSSLVPSILENAEIDEVVHVPEVESIHGCHTLLKEHNLFAGGSSGTSFSAISRYFEGKTFERKPNVLFLCPDGGYPYINTIYNPEWVEMVRSHHTQVHA